MANKTGFNDYIIEGEITKIILKDREGNIIYSLIDTEDLQRLIDLGYKWYARYHDHVDNYYAQCNQYVNGKHKVVTLHRFIMNYIDGKVDHKKPTETLNNRKSNLRKVESADNSANRKGANKNSGTGVRNVNWIEKQNEYWVQIMRHGIRYKWTFPSDQFQEACDFAELKRQEIFGEFAGNG